MGRLLTRISLVLAVTMVLMLTACAGGGSSNGTASNDGNPVAPSTSNDSASTGNDGAKTIYGRIQGFGSIVVNGVHYDISDANITFNDRPGRASKLFIGQMVTINATDPGQGEEIARSVVFDADIDGPIGSIDRDHSRFTVLDQTIIVSGTTAFKGAEFSDLASGNYVEISGSFDADGAIRASSVQLKTEKPGSVGVKGRVANLDTANRTFTLNGLSVDYEKAVKDPSDLRLSNGLFVDVRGTASSGSLSASRVERTQRVDARPGEHVALDGYIESIDSGTRFTVAGQSVRYDSDTQFKNRGPVDVIPNAFARVEGVIDGNGILQARQIELKSEQTQQIAVRLNARIQAVDELDGTLKVLGVTVGTQSDTRFIDERDGVRPFGLNNLQVGDFVDVRALMSDGSLLASAVKREASEDSVSIQSPFRSIDEAANMLVIEGVPVDLSQAQYKLPEAYRNLPITRLYDLIEQGALVKVEGQFNGSYISASSVALSRGDVDPTASESTSAGQ